MTHRLHRQMPNGRAVKGRQNKIKKKKKKFIFTLSLVPSTHTLSAFAVMWISGARSAEESVGVAMILYYSSLNTKLVSSHAHCSTRQLIKTTDPPRTSLFARGDPFVTLTVSRSSSGDKISRNRTKKKKKRVKSSRVL